MQCDYVVILTPTSEDTKATHQPRAESWCHVTTYWNVTEPWEKASVDLNLYLFLLLSCNSETRG